MITTNSKVILKFPAIDDRIYTVVNLFQDYEVEEEGNEPVLVEFADIRQNSDDKPHFIKTSDLQLVGNTLK